MTNKFDKAMDIIGAAAVGVPLVFTGLPGWAVGLCGLAAFIVGRVAGKGIPIYSSFKPVPKDARGQVSDSEVPK